LKPATELNVERFLTWTHACEQAPQ
jgi:hypothetical protein